ncbi:hypothetical protein GWI72_13855 [Microvirga tunisiensis]|uniref:Uncharacterized protein n=2 Tax=Pannonibacter tanglangensis TaxID=2750084 RepID=A0A7X5F3Z2_9HYPH|nr:MULTISPECIES: hypothetical protein [unclassified Pannonibacter]NBN64854.1 hypothetical protein [Pannonibacter sp. XCT-34]NBN79357.1 hypothetical protein [Pannonibacter sp. XCT-53]
MTETADHLSGPLAVERSPAPVVTTLVAAIAKAHAVVEAETLALREQAGVDLRAYEHRKSQALLELTRASRGLIPAGIDGLRDTPVAEELARLRAALDANMTLLEKHLDAVREIADVISRAMIEAESDGTYGAQIAGWRP